MIDHLSLVHRLKSLMNTPPRGQAAWEELLATLTSIDQSVQKLFSEEEQSGYLEEALLASPERDREARRLRRQHRTLVRELESIIAGVKRQDMTAFAQSKLWVIQFEKHEQREKSLMQEAFIMDLGTGD